MGYFSDAVLLGVKTAAYDLAEDLNYAHRNSDLHQAMLEPLVAQRKAQARRDAVVNTLSGAAHGLRAGDAYSHWDDDDEDLDDEASADVRRRRNTSRGVGAGLGALAGAAGSYMDYQNAEEDAHSDVEETVAEAQRALAAARARHGDAYDINKDITLGHRSQLHGAYRDDVRQEMGYGPSYSGMITGGYLGGALGAGLGGVLSGHGGGVAAGGLGGLLLGGYLGNRIGKAGRDGMAQEQANNLLAELQKGNSGARARYNARQTPAAAPAAPEGAK